jgi:hypothetical protein
MTADLSRASGAQPLEGSSNNGDAVVAPKHGWGAADYSRASS